jgi:hypothetical protein
MGREAVGKLWPLELLAEGKAEVKNPRIMLVKYDSKRLEREHFLFNIPDNDIDILATNISK